MPTGFVGGAGGLPGRCIHEKAVCGRRGLSYVARQRVYASALEERPVNVAHPKSPVSIGSAQHAELIQPPKTKYIIRSARVDELDTVTEVRCNSFYSYLADDKYLFFQRKREIREVVLGRWKNPNAYCLVAADPDTMELVGTCDATVHECSRTVPFLFFPNDNTTSGKKIYVSSMAVRPDTRRKGVAKSILAKVLDVAKTLSVAEVYLHVEWENKPAVWLYQKCGFERYKGTPPNWIRNMSRPEHTLLVKRLS